MYLHNYFAQKFKVYECMQVKITDNYMGIMQESVIAVLRTLLNHERIICDLYVHLRHKENYNCQCSGHPCIISTAVSIF